MAKDRIILAFLYLFYIAKIIEKSLFYEPEIGFIGKITTKGGLDIFFNFLTLETF
jgi:hypothetical protein